MTSSNARGTRALSQICKYSAMSLTEQVASLLCNYLKPTSLTEGPVVKLASPQDLDAAFASAGCALAIAKGDPPLDDETILAAFRLTLEYSVRTGGPGFFNQVRFVVYSRVHACLQATIISYEHST